MEILIYILAGLLAGIATGLVGLSAATIIAPLFATMLGMDPYTAIGIALASDVLASATSATNYFKNKNIDLRSGVIMGISVILFTILASYLSSFAKPFTLSTTINVFVFFLGIRFIVYPVKSSSKTILIKKRKWLITQTVLWGAIIGMISGYFGSGGGLSMLAVLTMLLGYNLKKGIGTSVFIMTGVAFVGAVTHIAISGTIILPLVVTTIAAFIGANIASRYANKIPEIKLNRIVGSFLIVYGISLIVVHFFY